MAASRRAEVLRLYRALLRESQGFNAYGYRTYAIRKIRDAFRENKNIQELSEIDTLINKAKTNLEMIRRQSLPKSCLEYLKACNCELLKSVHLKEICEKEEACVTIGQLYTAEKLVIECPQKV